VPPQTLDAFRERGTAAAIIMTGVDEARQQIADLEKLGILILQPRINFITQQNVIKNGLIES
jgi:hypothetical protein